MMKSKIFGFVLRPQCAIFGILLSLSKTKDDFNHFICFSSWSSPTPDQDKGIILKIQNMTHFILWLNIQCTGHVFIYCENSIIFRPNFRSPKLLNVTNCYPYYEIWFHEYLQASIFVNLVKIRVSRIHIFVTIDSINIVCYQIFHFNRHFILWINSITKS